MHLRMWRKLQNSIRTKIRARCADSVFRKLPKAQKVMSICEKLNRLCDHQIFAAKRVLQFPLWCICLMAIFAFADTEIGTVVAVFGRVQAEREGGQVEYLERGAPVYLHDLMQVDDKSHVQIKLNDGSLFNLIPGTHYRVNQFVARGVEANMFSSELLKGGLRGITGKIAKSNPEGVSVKTPTSVIGLRGTIFEIVISATGTFFGCESGEIFVSNSAGSLPLGPRVSQQFGIVVGPNAAPQALGKRPDALQLNRFILPRGCS